MKEKLINVKEKREENLDTGHFERERKLDKNQVMSWNKNEGKKNNGRKKLKITKNMK